MNIKWKIALVILPSTLFAFYGASIVYGWLTITFGEFVGYVFFLPAERRDRPDVTKITTGQNIDPPRSQASELLKANVILRQHLRTDA